MSTDSLAINGGTPVREQPMPARALFGEEEKMAAVALFDDAIRTGGVFGYNGREEQAFEEEFAAFLGGGYADGVNSGTSAVFAALGALHLEAGSEVIVPPITDPGGAMPVAMLNCVPVLADADPRSYNMGPAQFAAAITERTRALIVAHIAGEPADMAPIMEIARRHDILVLEDCAQSPGARYAGQVVGTIGDIAAFSTMSGKHFATAAQGGIVFTRNEELHWRGKRFADRGKPFNIPDAGAGNVTVGLNLNLNELSAAIGRVQLRKLPDIIANRQRVGESVKAGLAGLAAVSMGWQPPESQAVYWFMRVTLEADKLTVDKAEFVAALQAEGISVNPGYRHIQSERPWWQDRDSNWCPWLFKDKGEKNPSLPNAVAAAESNFNVSVHENYGDQEADDVIAALAKVEAAFLKA